MNLHVVTIFSNLSVKNRILKLMLRIEFNGQVHFPAGLIVKAEVSNISKEKLRLYLFICLFIFSI